MAHARHLTRARPPDAARTAAGWIVVILAATGCAQVEPPNGGPEDKTLPRVAGMHPDSGAVGAAPDTISILFSKPMDRPSVRDWTFISPPVPIRETIWMTRSRVDLVLDRRPDSSRTYTILLGAEVTDRRRNSLGPWSAAFSTGPQVDTGAVEGKVIGRKLKAAGAYVYVWRWSDSTATEQTEPTGQLRMGQAKADGSFRVNWLPRNEPLRICALYDASRDRSFDSDDDVWGCLGEPLVLDDTTRVLAGFELYLVLPDEPGILEGTAIDSSCIAAGEPALLRLSHEADSLSALIGRAPGAVSTKSKGLADSLVGFGPVPRRFQEIDTLAIRLRLGQIDSLRTLARTDSVRCAKPIIVRLFERDTSLVSEARGKESYEFRDVPAGSYEIRGFRDLNGNGLVDPGEPAGGLPDSITLKPGRTAGKLDFPLRGGR